MGAGIYTNESSIYIINSLIKGNKGITDAPLSQGWGFGIDSYNSNVFLINSTVTGNSGDDLTQAFSSGIQLDNNPGDDGQAVI